MKIKITKKNESTISIECNSTIAKELSNYFSVFVNNYRFNPKYKAGVWDGKLRIFTASHELPIGLIEKVYEFARGGKYEVECAFERFNEIKREDFDKFVSTLKLPFAPRDYQLEAAFQACRRKHLNVQISTAGGKSLVIYIIIRFLKYLGLSGILILPNVQLVEQMYSDFENYGWNVHDNCHRIYGGEKKRFDLPVTISTWQSLYTDNKLFAGFEYIICDEAHLGAAKSIQSIAKYSINCAYRFGFSGTYPDPTMAEWYTVVGAFGPIQVFATYKSLQDDGHIANLQIFNIVLEYPKEYKLEVLKACNKDYAKETDYVYGNPARCEVICRMAEQFTKNSLFLFTKKEAHGYKLLELFKERLKGKKELYYIDGDVDIKEREKMRKMMELRNDVILLATYGTLSTGLNVKNIHNICFCSGYKSKVKVLQSIGRMLRTHESKNIAKLYDIADDLKLNTKEVKYINHSMRHLQERIKYYDEQHFNYKTIKIPIKT